MLVRGKPMDHSKSMQNEQVCIAVKGIIPANRDFAFLCLNERNISLVAICAVI